MTDLCVKCGKKPFFNVLNKLCEPCFLEVVEKRVRRFVRGKDLFKKNSNVLLVDDGSAEAKVGEFLFKSIFKDFPLKFEVVEKQFSDISSKDIENHDRIIVPWNLDMDAENLLSSIFHKKNIPPDNNKFVKLLSSLSKEEIVEFARLKGFVFTQKSISEASKFIDLIEKKYPGTKFSIINSREKLT